MLIAGRSRFEYAEAFEAEAKRTYPVIDALEMRLGYVLSPSRYLPAAEVLACPVKKDKHGQLRQVALWQHGRLLYSVVRALFAGGYARWPFPLTTLDIGTAKGYSALCVRWALDDAGFALAEVHSVDVLDPLARVPRHTVAEVDGLKTLAEFLTPWPAAQRIQFHQSTGIAWLEQFDGRLPFVYVDGKHNAATVRKESALIRYRQQAGDVTVFDDVQILEVAAVLASLGGYDIEYIRPTTDRAYAIARRQ
jgi:hypothetical protein